jgi:hypothetical protein
MSGCGRCHTCGAPLRVVLDGEEWCHTCGTYRRYRSHGFSPGYTEDNPICLEVSATTGERGGRPP